MNNRKRFEYFVWASLLLMLTACGTSPSTRMYILEPVAVQSADRGRALLSITVNEVTLPKHLARKEILSRDRHFMVSTAEFDRWAEPLGENITSVLAENLSVLLGSDRVVAYPWSSGEGVDFTVNVQVLAFSPDPSGDVVLNALWRIADSAGDTVALKKSHYSEASATNDIIATVSAMSRTVGALSQDIASMLRTLSTNTDADERAK